MEQHGRYGTAAFEFSVENTGSTTSCSPPVHHHGILDRSAASHWQIATATKIASLMSGVHRLVVILYLAADAIPLLTMQNSRERAIHAAEASLTRASEKRNAVLDSCASPPHLQRTSTCNNGA